jgi:sugar lactone lactonase YvrE
MKFGRRAGAITAGISLAAAGLIVTGQSALAAAGDPYYSTVVATPGLTTQGLTFDASGTMYVADTAFRSIDRVNADGSLTPVVSSGLQGASGILADGNKGLYISDTNNSLFKYWDATTGTVTVLSSAVATPHGLTWGPDGDVYIADSINNRIAKWDPRTSTLSAAAYNLNYPSDVAVAPNGDIYAADTSNHRIAYFPASNPYVPQTLVSNVSYPLGVALDKAGNLFFADLSNQLIEKRDASTGVVSTIWHTSNNIYGLRFGPDGSLYMTDSSQILKLNPYSAPSAPQSLSTTTGDGSIDLTFDAPASDGGSAITGYDVSSNGGTSWNAASTTGSGPFTTTVIGLTNGISYALQVRADNSIGNGTAATAAPAIPDVSPAAPSDLTATANGAGSIDLNFTAPVDNGGSAITGYEASTDGGTKFSPLKVDDSATPITATVSGLAHGTTYAVQVRAINAGGPGQAATANDANPTDVPSAPQAVAATSSDKSLNVEFQVPSSDGGLAITKYQASVDGTKWTDVVTTAGPSDGVLDTAVTGLTNGTSYTVQLRAVNADGPGAAGSADPATPLGVPGAPSILGQVTGNGSIQLSFSAPTDDGGSPISYYQVSTDDGKNWNYALPYQDNPLTVNVSGLDNGISYRLQLRALNDQGNGAVATASTATPSTLPGAPTGLTAVSGNASARLSFTPPTDNGGAYISSYQYTFDGGGHWLTLDVDQLNGVAKNAKNKLTQPTYTATLAGLTNGRQYTVQIRAVNVQGGGTSSDPVSVSPVAPVPPTTVKINGPAAQVVGAGSTVTIAGTAPAGSSVKIYFHERGQTGYVLRRTLIASKSGTFNTSYVANDDYRYYAQVGSTVSDSVLTQAAPTVAGPLSQVVKKNSTVVLKGTGVAGSTVRVHFHQAGTAANDFNIVRDVVVAANGTWTRSYVASVDYRFFVSSTTNSLTTSTYLVQTR